MTEQGAAAVLADDRWKWTVDAYDKAVDAGVFGPDDKVELLEGEVCTIAAMLPGHAAAVDLLRDLVTRQLDPALWAVGSQTPVRVDGRSEPEPDLWVAKGNRKTYLHRHPGPQDLVLLVEVADTSLGRDRNVKIPSYAGVGVPYAWLVSLGEQTITAYSAPVPAERRYDHASVFRGSETVTHPPTGLSVDIAQLT